MEIYTVHIIMAGVVVGEITEYRDRVEIGGGVYYHGAHTTTLYVMVDIVDIDPHQPGPIFQS